MKFKILIKETLEHICEIDANNDEEAVGIIENQYAKEKIVLGSEDYTCTEIKPYVDEN